MSSEYRGGPSGNQSFLWTAGPRFQTDVTQKTANRDLQSGADVLGESDKQLLDPCRIRSHTRACTHTHSEPATCFYALIIILLRDALVSAWELLGENWCFSFLICWFQSSPSGVKHVRLSCGKWIDMPEGPPLPAAPFSPQLVFFSLEVITFYMIATCLDLFMLNVLPVWSALRYLIWRLWWEEAMLAITGCENCWGKPNLRWSLHLCRACRKESVAIFLLSWPPPTVLSRTWSFKDFKLLCATNRQNRLHLGCKEKERESEKADFIVKKI